MARRRHRSIVDVHILLRRHGKILMLRRAGTGYGDGMLHLPSGHLERRESAVDAMVRETREETGIAVDPTALRCAHVMHRGDPHGDDRVGFFFEVSHWIGEPRNSEPDKCAELVWVDPAALPADTIDYPAAAIAYIQQGVSFSVHDWAGGDSRTRPPASSAQAQTCAP